MSRLLPWHRVGQIVVCIDASPVYSRRRHPPLVLKAVYDIAHVLDTLDGVFLALSQIDAVESEDVGAFIIDYVPAYSAERFRPVAPTSIEMFRQERVPAEVDA